MEGEKTCKFQSLLTDLETSVNLSPFIPQSQDIFLHQVNDIVQPHPEGEAFANHVFLQQGRKNTIHTEAQQCSVADRPDRICCSSTLQNFAQVIWQPE